MSEVINNRQQRIGIMKNLVRQLHRGVAEEQVRRQLETMLDETDYSDVFVMEVQLVQEGLPAEEIQELCDTHTRVLRKHLDLSETPETLPGHPVNTFVRENRELTKTTAQVRLLMQRVEALADDHDATEPMRGIQALLNGLTDADKHYRRKEYLLFPFFEKNQLPGPPMVMWGKHDEARTLLRETIAGLQQAESLTAAEAKAYNLFAVTPAIEAIDEMVYKEEKILFPTALNLLTEQDWYDIYVQSDEYGYCLYAPEFEWRPEGGVHREIRQPAAAGGRRSQMPTGSFSVDELIATFSTLPLDLTFVDKDDTVRYFTPGKAIFDRSPRSWAARCSTATRRRACTSSTRFSRDFKAGKEDRALLDQPARAASLHLLLRGARRGGRVPRHARGHAGPDRGARPRRRAAAAGL